MFDFEVDENLTSVLVSVLCGAIVGFEREFKNKSAGFRTVVLICLGSTVFTIISRMGNLSDDRIAANIVTGIGFLGAGVIYQGKFSVQGLTTAAVIWSMAAVGMMVGFQHYGFALILTACMVVVLSLFQKMELMLSNIYFARNIHVTFENVGLAKLAEFEQTVQKHRVKLNRKGWEKKGQHLTILYELTGTRKNIGKANAEIISLDYVYAFTNL